VFIDGTQIGREQQGSVTPTVIQWASGGGKAWLDDVKLSVIKTSSVYAPTNESPAPGAVEVSLTPTLEASDFRDPDPGDTHASSHWQMRAASTPPDYSVTAYDSGETTTLLTSCPIPAGWLNYHVTYYWRVCYKDNHDEWSPWSSETLFTTLDAPSSSPDKPANVSPPPLQTGVSLSPLLAASLFSDPDAGDFQSAVHWRVRKASGSYANPVYDSGLVSSGASQHRVPSGLLAPSTDYFWQARYRDSRGISSPWSDETGFQTIDANGLSAPEGLRAAPGATSVWLTWIVHRDQRVTGYNLYRAESVSGPWNTPLTSETIRGRIEHLDENLEPAKTYYYRLTALTQQGLESPMTQAVQARAGTARIFMRNLRGMPGATISQMITIDNPNNIVNTGMQLDIRFGPLILTPTGVANTVLTKGFSFSYAIPSSGLLRILDNAASEMVITGEGCVMQAAYTVSASAQDLQRSFLSFDYA